MQDLDFNTNLIESAQDALRGPICSFRRSTFSTASEDIVSNFKNRAPNAFESDCAGSGSALSSPAFLQSSKQALEWAPSSPVYNK
jgi:hypothetical protein